MGIVGLWGYYIYQNINDLTLTPPTTYDSTPSPTPTDIVIPTPTLTDLEYIKIAFANKRGKPVADVIIKISENISTQARGSISFKGENGGGWWLAAKVKNQWVAVADGNGYVSCDAVKDYKFPKSMIPECVDTKGKLIIL
jgi:hypothetical protein